MAPAGLKRQVLDADYAALIPYNKWLAPFRGYLASAEPVHDWLIELTGGQVMADCQIPLTTIASDLETGTATTFTMQKNPDMLVADAILASMSIPDVFPAFQGRYVDGGVLCNLGVQYLPGKHKRLGLRVSEAQTIGPVTGLLDEQERLISMMLSASETDEMLLAKSLNIPVISLPGGNLGFLNRSMTQAQKLSLYEAGYCAAQSWCETPAGKAWLTQS
jgi:predicted acylesterase/phospholipase RssA